MITIIINSYQNSVSVWYILKHSSILHEHLLKFLQYLGSTYWLDGFSLIELGETGLVKQAQWAAHTASQVCPLLIQFRIIRSSRSFSATSNLNWLYSSALLMLSSWRRSHLGDKKIFSYICIHVYDLLCVLGSSIGSYILHLSSPVFLTPIRPCTVDSTETASCPVHYDQQFVWVRWHSFEFLFSTLSGPTAFVSDPVS